VSGRDPADGPPQAPGLRITAGAPTPEEVAAVTAVLLALLRPAAGPAGSGGPAGPGAAAGPAPAARWAAPRIEPAGAWTAAAVAAWPVAV
jgi:hypothetical protein